MKKYELTEEINDAKLSRLKALIDFNDGEVGDNARVCGNTEVYGGAKLYSNAWVSDNARVCGNVKVLSLFSLIVGLATLIL